MTPAAKAVVFDEIARAGTQGRSPSELARALERAGFTHTAREVRALLTEWRADLGATTYYWLKR